MYSNTNSATNNSDSFELGIPVVYYFFQNGKKKEWSGEVTMNSELYEDRDSGRTYQPRSVKGISVYRNEDYSGPNNIFIVPDWQHVETFAEANKRTKESKELLQHLGKIYEEVTGDNIIQESPSITAENVLNAMKEYDDLGYVDGLPFYERAVYTLDPGDNVTPKDAFWITGIYFKVFKDEEDILDPISDIYDKYGFYEIRESYDKKIALGSKELYELVQEENSAKLGLFYLDLENLIEQKLKNKNKKLLTIDDVAPTILDKEKDLLGKPKQIWMNKRFKFDDQGNFDYEFQDQVREDFKKALLEDGRIVKAFKEGRIPASDMWQLFKREFFYLLPAEIALDVEKKMLKEINPEESEKLNSIINRFPFLYTKNQYLFKELSNSPYGKKYELETAEDDHVNMVEYALRANAFQDQINQGVITVRDAINIIESAGLEVPKELLEMKDNDRLPNALEDLKIGTEINFLRRKGLGLNEGKVATRGKIDQLDTNSQGRRIYGVNYTLKDKKKHGWIDVEDIVEVY